MADSKQKIDWNALGKTAQQCVSFAYSLAYWGDRSQKDGYSADDAALHLTAIGEAADILDRAIPMFRRRHFTKIALASVGEGPRPDFRFGEACYSTAHESALELLRAGVLHIENGLNDIAEDQGLPDNYLVGIDDLHSLSPDDLRDILVDVYARPVTAWAVKEIGFARVKEFQAWIDREWAAVSRTPNGADSEGDSTPEQSETVDASGEVTNPSDPTAYVSASIICTKHVPSDFAITERQLRAILRNHPKIRRWHPWSQRLKVHLVDWMMYREQEEHNPPTSGNVVRTADNPDFGLNPNLPPEAAARAAAIRKKGRDGQ